jgi:hypothetical protein
MMTRAHGPSDRHAAAMTIDRHAAMMTDRHADATTTVRRADAMKSGRSPLASRLANSAATPANLAKAKPRAVARWTATVAAVGVVAAAAVAGDEDAARMTAWSSGPTRPPPIVATLNQATASEARPTAPMMRGRFATRVAPTEPTTRGRRRGAVIPGRAVSVKVNRAIEAMTIRVRAAAAVDAVVAVAAAGARRMSPAEMPPQATRRPAGRRPAAKATTNRFRPPTACVPGSPAQSVAMPRGPTGPRSPRKATTQPAAKAVAAGAGGGVAARDGREATVNPRLRHHHRAVIRASHASEAGVAGGRPENLGRPLSRGAAAMTSHRSPAVTKTMTRALSSSGSRRLARSRSAVSGPPRTKTSSSKAASTRCSTCPAGSRRSGS